MGEGSEAQPLGIDAPPVSAHTACPTAQSSVAQPLGIDAPLAPALAGEGDPLWGRLLRLPRPCWMTLMAVGLSLTGMAMLLVALWLPPRGSIEPSVLVAYGEVMTFVGALLGISYSRR